MLLKSLTLFIGEAKLQIRNTKMDGDNQIPTPIDFDPIAKTAVVHFSDKEKMNIDLTNLVMYQYTIE